MPSSRPKPLCLKPPNGVETRTDEFELIDRTPVSLARATRNARGPALVERARAREPALARVADHRVGRGRGGALEVGVGKDDIRRLAAELERDALDRPRCAAHHLLSDLGRAGEADLRDVGMLDQPLSDDGSLSGHDV